MPPPVAPTVVARVEAAAAALRAEVLALPPEAFVPMPARERYRSEAGSAPAWMGLLLRAGRWESEFPGVDFAENARRCPVAAALISELPVSTVAGYLRLEPGGVLEAHADPREDDELRLHLALQLPPEEQAHWPIGAARWLDTRVPHTARNPSPLPRLTFVVDLRLQGAFSGTLPPWNSP